MKPTEVFRPRRELQPLAELKTCFPVKPSPPLAIQFIFAADSHSGPNLISTFIFIFHTYSINKANTNKAFRQTSPAASLPWCKTHLQPAPAGNQPQLQPHPSSIPISIPIPTSPTAPAHRPGSRLCHQGNQPGYQGKPVFPLLLLCTAASRESLKPNFC